MNHDAIIFDIDDTLYNSTRLSITARANAIEAMIDAGLPVDQETGTELLAGVIQRLGHGLPWNPGGNSDQGPTLQYVDEDSKLLYGQTLRC